jgi:hypothetical protein
MPAVIFEPSTTLACARARILACMGFIFDIIFELFASVFHLDLHERGARRRQEQSSQIDCGLRVVAGTHAGLQSRWRVRRTRVHPGGLDFGRKTPTLVRVRNVATERQYSPRWPGMRIDSSFQIVEVETDSATLEWAVPEDKLEWALEHVRGTGKSAGPIG